MEQEDRDNLSKIKEKCVKRKSKVNTFMRSYSESNFGHSLHRQHSWKELTASMSRHVLLNKEPSKRDDAPSKSDKIVMLRELLGAATSEKSKFSGHETQRSDKVTYHPPKSSVSFNENDSVNTVGHSSSGERPFEEALCIAPNVETIPLSEDTIQRHCHKDPLKRETMGGCHDTKNVLRDNASSEKGKQWQDIRQPDVSDSSNSKKINKQDPKHVQDSFLGCEKAGRNWTSAASLPGKKELWRRSDGPVCHLKVPTRARSKSARTNSESKNNRRATPETKFDALNLRVESTFGKRVKTESSGKSDEAFSSSTSPKCENQAFSSGNRQAKAILPHENTESVNIEHGSTRFLNESPSQEQCNIDQNVAVSIPIPPLPSPSKSKSLLAFFSTENKARRPKRNQTKPACVTESHQHTLDETSKKSRPRYFGTSTSPKHDKRKTEIPEDPGQPLKRTVPQKTTNSTEMCLTAVTLESKTSMEIEGLRLKVPHESTQNRSAQSSSSSSRLDARRLLKTKSATSMHSDHFAYATMSPILSLACSQDSSITIDVPAEDNLSPHSLTAGHPCYNLYRVGLLPRCTVPVSLKIDIAQIMDKIITI